MDNGRREAWQFQGTHAHDEHEQLKGKKKKKKKRTNKKKKRAPSQFPGGKK
jgi:hypothetical protein